MRIFLSKHQAQSTSQSLVIKSSNTVTWILKRSRIWNIKYQCTSFVCAQFGNLSTICTTMSCKDPTDVLGVKCFNHVAATGTSCGNRQVQFKTDHWPTNRKERWLLAFTETNQNTKEVKKERFLKKVKTRHNNVHIFGRFCLRQSDERTNIYKT